MSLDTPQVDLEEVVDNDQAHVWHHLTQHKPWVSRQYTCGNVCKETDRKNARYEPGLLLKLGLRGQ